MPLHGEDTGSGGYISAYFSHSAERLMLELTVTVMVTNAVSVTVSVTVRDRGMVS